MTAAMPTLPSISANALIQRLNDTLFEAGLAEDFYRAQRLADGTYHLDRYEGTEPTVIAIVATQSLLRRVLWMLAGKVDALDYSVYLYDAATDELFRP